MKFYVNEIHSVPESDWYHQCMGLFTDNEWEGEGNFCGWYSAEYYLDTTLIAYGIQLLEGNRGYDPFYPFSEVKYVNQHYDKIAIRSIIGQESFEANDIEEALKIFSEQNWPSKRRNQ